jgi:hypothetical protein
MPPLYVQDLELLDQRLKDIVGNFNTSSSDVRSLCRHLLDKCKALTKFAGEVEKSGEDLGEQLDQLPSDEEEISRETWFRKRHDCFQAYFKYIEDRHSNMTMAVCKMN